MVLQISRLIREVCDIYEGQFRCVGRPYAWLWDEPCAFYEAIPEKTTGATHRRYAGIRYFSILHGKYKFASALESQRGPRSMQSAVDAFTSAPARDGSHSCGCACGSLRRFLLSKAPTFKLVEYLGEGREAKVGLLAGETRKGWAMREWGYVPS